MQTVRTSSTVLLVLSCVTALTAAEPLDIGNRRELFIDDALIDKLTGKAEQRLHHPQPREIVIKHDAPWEGSASGYHSVFRDGERYRMYYRGSTLQVVNGKLKQDAHPVHLCYAESDDGVTWNKPNLGLCEFNGSKENSIVLSAAQSLGAPVDVGHPGVFKDENPNVSADARYKAIFAGLKVRGLFPFKSPDGFHWTPMSESPMVTHGAFDSQNLAFWDSHLGAYRAYWRYFTGGETNDKVWKPSGNRAIRTAVSRDLLTWTDEHDLAYVDSPDEQLYTNCVRPYERAPHLLIGFPTRYVDRGWSDSMRALPDRENREARAVANRRYGTAITESLLMASRDGVKFKRWNEAFIPPGPERPGSWNYGHQFTAWQIVETQTAIDGGPELSLYATQGYWSTPGTALRRYALRIDGFVSIHASLSGGELVTRPLKFSGKQLLLNFATSAAGSIRVEVQNGDGKPMPGFALDDCEELFGDTLERTVTWSGGKSLDDSKGQPVRFRFALKDADLYAMQVK